LSAIGVVIDPQYWMHRFKKSQPDLELVKQIIKESNL